MWLNFAVARLLMALSSGVMITIGNGLFFLTWERPVSGRGEWQTVPLFYAFALIASVSAFHYSSSLMERLVFEPERVQGLLFHILKWIAAANVRQFHVATTPASPSTGETAGKARLGRGGEERHGIFRYGNALKAMLAIQEMSLISNQAWKGTRGVPAATLIVSVWLSSPVFHRKRCYRGKAAHFQYGKFGIDGKRGGRATLLAKVIHPEDR